MIIGDTNWILTVLLNGIKAAVHHGDLIVIAELGAVSDSFLDFASKVSIALGVGDIIDFLSLALWLEKKANVKWAEISNNYEINTSHFLLSFSTCG